MAVIAGKVAPRFMGVFNLSTTYQFYDAVTHNNKLYFCKKSGTVGKAPTGATDDNWFLSLDGTFADSASLGGETAEAWQTKLDNIQTTSRATLSTAGWYRVAEYKAAGSAMKGNRNNSCEIIFKQSGVTYRGLYHLALISSDGSQEFEPKRVNITGSGNQTLMKVRYTYEGTTAYIEVYNRFASNFEYTLIFPKDTDFCWRTIDAVLTSETVSGVTVTTTYDIPANASPVTDLDVGYLEKYKRWDSWTSVLTPDLGIYLILSSQVSLITDLPSGLSGQLWLIKLKGTDENMFILHRPNAGTTYLGSQYGTNITWSNPLATTADLANYLPKTGGTLTGPLTFNYNGRQAYFIITDDGRLALTDVTNSKVLMEFSANGATNTFNGTASGNLPLSGGMVQAPNTVPLKLKNTNGTACYIPFYDKDGTIGYLGFSGSNTPVFLTKDASVTSALLHTGNSAKVAIQESAPTDTTSLWVDTANNKVKAYKDGAWTAMA